MASTNTRSTVHKKYREIISASGATMSSYNIDECPLTIQDMLLKWSQIKPQATAFIFYDNEWNRRAFSRLEIFQLASRYAAILKRQGINKGDIVCNTLPNSPERLITQFGCTLAGAVSLNGQVFLKNESTFMECLRTAKCKALIVNPADPCGPLKLLQSQMGEGWTNGMPLKELPDIQLVLECRWETQGDDKSIMDIIENENETYVSEAEPTDPVHIFTTSGTTGFSKMILRNHIELTRLTNAARQALDIKEGEVYYNDRPLGWYGGYPMLYPVAGNTRVLTDLSKGQSKEPFKFMWDLICKEKCDVGFIVPFHLERLSQIYDTHGGSGWKLRSVLSGGQPLKKSHLDSVGKITFSLSVTYGSTEAGTISYTKITDRANYADCNNGPLLAGVEVKIVDSNMQEVPFDTQGRILIRSNQVCKSYLYSPDADAYSFLEDGWFRSGDVGYINSLGEISVICREKFVIMHGAYLVYPGWIEVLLLKCPDIQGVTVVPVPDPVLHQEICACVIRKPDSDVSEEKLNTFFQSFFIKKDASKQCAFPKYYLFFSTFPTTLTGKVCRHTLQRVATQRLGLCDL